MSEFNVLTTRSTQWSRIPSSSPQWTTRGDGFHVDFKIDEELPLTLLDTIAPVTKGGGVEKRKCKESGKLMAIKKGWTFGDPKANTALSAEVKILRPLKHYHCISMTGSYTQGDSFSIIMDPLANCDLEVYLSKPSSNVVKEMIRNYGPQSSFLPKIMGCLAHGLQYLHKEPTAWYDTGDEKMVRHRDIKPANILLDGQRVLFADFGLSKVFTATQTGSSGPSPGGTLMYNSPERQAGKHRNSSCDVFSLACVFAQIFTVYKGRTTDDFLKHRINADPGPKKEGYFHNAQVKRAVLRWLDGLATERCDVQIIRLLRSMFSLNPKQRPSAEQVWKSLTTYTTNTDMPTYFCGPCCMPLLRDDPLLSADNNADPSKTLYAYSLPVISATCVRKEPFFWTRNEKNLRLDLGWKRNLRHWDHSTLDVVQDGKHPNLLARKRILSSGDDEGSIIARNEAEILKEVEHRHIVTLDSTYRLGNVFTLFFEPAADHDLRSYLELAELYRSRQDKSVINFKFLTRSFGCLANALAYVHAAGYDHGDIRPENILVHNSRIYLSKFSFGLKLDNERRGSGPSNQRLYRSLDFLGKLSLGWGESRSTVGTERQPRQQPGPYQPPEWQPTSIGQDKADIFALGCVFFEIYTVLRGRRVRDFEEFRAVEEGETAYHRTLPKTLEWLSEMDKEGHENEKWFQEHKNQRKFEAVLRQMIETDASKRPTAIEVHHAMKECETFSGWSFCGDCPKTV